MEHVPPGAAEDDDYDGVRPHDPHSSLTHTLPLQKLRKLSEDDLLWKLALRRHLDRDPGLRRPGLLQISGLNKGYACVLSATSTEQLLESVKRFFGRECQLTVAPVDVPVGVLDCLCWCPALPRARSGTRLLHPSNPPNR